MTVKELKEKLASYPDNMDVFIAERKTEFTYGLLNSVTAREIVFQEDEFPDEDDDGPEATETVLVLDEE